MPSSKLRANGFSGKKVVKGYCVSISFLSLTWTTNSNTMFTTKPVLGKQRFITMVGFIKVGSFNIRSVHTSRIRRSVLDKYNYPYKITYNNYICKFWQLKYTIPVLSSKNLTRFISTLPYKPENLAIRHIESKKPITSEVINSLLLNQKVFITKEELNKLLNISFVEFKLPLDSNSSLPFTKLVGRPNSRGRYAGVYIFTHIETGQMYVGSSNSLGRRLSQYFEPEKGYVNKNESGLLLPLIKKDGFSKFTLKIYVIPSDCSICYDYLFLEQYFLLDPKFTLNTQKIVNFRINQGTHIYMYNSDFSVLYHTSLSLNMLKKEIGIHISNIKSSIDKGELFLNTFRITTVYYSSAVKSEMSLQELNKFIDLKRKDVLLNNRAKPIYLYNKDLTILYYTSNSYSALNSVLRISPESARNCIKTGSLYLGYFSIKPELVPGISDISISLGELKDLLLNKRKEHRLKSLKKGQGSGNIALSVLCNESKLPLGGGEVPDPEGQAPRGGLEKDFSSISAACTYLRSEGTVINPTTITKYLDSGKVYKGYLFIRR